MNELLFSPLMSRNHTMAVPDKAPNTIVLTDLLSGWTKEKTTRLSHITITPKTKATATLAKIAIITLRALSVLSSEPMPSGTPLASTSPAAIFTTARAKAPPSISKTKLTVVDVGIPSELKTSNNTTSVTITARKIHITS